MTLSYRWHTVEVRKEASGLCLLSELHGVQVVGGSNPPAPTIEPYLKSPNSVNKKSSKTVNNNQFAATFLKRLSLVQVKLRLSDRTLAKKLGISNAYLSYIKRGQREITSAFIQRASVLPGLESFAAKKSNISVSFCTYFAHI